MTLKDLDKGKNQNIQLTRFIAAMLVVYSHSFSLSLSDDSVEPFKILSGGQIYVGSLSVIIFFLVGGYFISKSAERIKSAKGFFRARIMKLWPPLFVVVMVSIIFCGFISSYSLGEYYTNPDTYKYLLNAFFIPVHNLPGVYENNVYACVVNGALWTMLAEFVCYIVCFIMYKIGMLKKKLYAFTIPIAVIFVAAMFIFEKQFEPVHVLLRACISFYIGIGFYVFRDKIKINKILGLVCGIVFLVLISIHQTDIGIYLFFPYALFVLWYGVKQVSDKFGYLGNLSYGIYLVSFVVQQTITYFFGGRMNSYINFILSSCIAIPLGFLIYNFIEKKCK